ncbi:MAG: hypothetical protein V5A72_01110 [Candidatus Nanohaloarchaea archaeon]
MKITDEAVRRRQTLKVDDTDRAYAELRDLLENRIALDNVAEEKYYNDVEKGLIRARLNADEAFDAHSQAVYEIFLTLDPSKAEMDIQIKGKIVTEYPSGKPWQGTLWYYGYRALFDKFLYGNIREGYDHAAEEKVDTILKRVRETLEA